MASKVVSEIAHVHCRRGKEPVLLVLRVRSHDRIVDQPGRHLVISGAGEMQAHNWEPTFDHGDRDPGRWVVVVVVAAAANAVNAVVVVAAAVVAAAVVAVAAVAAAVAAAAAAAARSRSCCCCCCCCCCCWHTGKVRLSKRDRAARNLGKGLARPLPNRVAFVE